MHDALRKLVFAFPFGCLVAIATHFVRFGDDHVFGGGASETIVAGAVGGAIIIAVAILHAFLVSGSTLVTGSLASARLRELVPGASAIFAIAASVYYGIESLEGNGIELGYPTLVLGATAALVAAALRLACASLARFVDGLVSEFVTARVARPLLAAARAPRRPNQRAQRLLTARRLGRAPPNERRFS